MKRLLSKDQYCMEKGLEVLRVKGQWQEVTREERAHPSALKKWITARMQREGETSLQSIGGWIGRGGRGLSEGSSLIGQRSADRPLLFHPTHPPHPHSPCSSVLYSSTCPWVKCSKGQNTIEIEKKYIKKNIRKFF